LKSKARKSYAVITPPVSVNEFSIWLSHAVALIGGLGNSPVAPRADGKLWMITSVAVLVVPFVSPSISPVTVPGTFPIVFVKEK
jgi:hypothetical protein